MCVKTVWRRSPRRSCGRRPRLTHCCRPDGRFGGRGARGSGSGEGKSLALPEAREKLSHGAPGFFVEGGKFFAYFSADHHGNGITAVLVRTSGVEEQAMLIERDPALYYRPPYLGPSGWIGLRLDTGDTDWAHVGEWLARSWRLAAPKRLTRLMDVADAF